LGYVYRMASSGKMVWVDAAAAARVLREIRHLLETTSLEARIRALQEAAEREPEGAPWQASSGRDHAARH
jgi:hypothetical protein